VEVPPSYPLLGQLPGCPSLSCWRARGMTHGLASELGAWYPCDQLEVLTTKSIDRTGLVAQATHELGWSDTAHRSDPVGTVVLWGCIS